MLSDMLNLLINKLFSDKAAVRSDAAAELDRLTRNQKKSVSNSSSVEGGGGNSLPNTSSEC